MQAGKLFVMVLLLTSMAHKGMGFVTGSAGVGWLQRCGRACPKHTLRARVVSLPSQQRTPLVAVKGLRMATTEADSWVRPAPRGKRDIVFGSRLSTSCPVSPAHDEGCNLGAYMMLPTDQYALIPLPNNAKLEKQSENLFSLRVPELQIFNVWLRPHVVTSVDVTPDGVMIEAQQCRLDGSPEVQRLKINDLFELSVKVVLAGRQDPRGLRSVIVCNSEISVWVDPPPIFRMMFPKPIMTETGNAVVRSTLRLLQQTFLQGLASDYNRWATDAMYRAERQLYGKS
jgi:hypothetical protein